MAHWTAVQLWREIGTDRILTAEEILARYGDWLRRHRIAIVDYPRGCVVQMDDGSRWERTIEWHG